ncbi:prepilin-type N-terminal cleavage/methylation domain-containing protein [Limibacillus halophilus]|uniref:General secretion pathway protein J n=1 Tax=Limibacillus halophilus TaxID=1579333 RepID=A0A839SR00_9PROT|nr:prepilin-type N-terminal cleavage/methylation domain-containing protein [Limibacillus halophilus]MBB3064708.1 general secretion pathway protein J [Limibacillus halophilus]
MNDRRKQNSVRQLAQSNDRSAGFTLLELLIALTLSGLILAGLGAGLRIVSSSWDRGAALAERHETIGMTQDFLRREFSRLQWLYWGAGDERRLAFEGERRRLRYIVAEPPYPDLPGLYAIELALVRAPGGGERLLRRRARFHPEERDFDDLEFTDDVVLLEDALGLQFAFAPENNGTTWRGQWSDGERLPRLVSLAPGASAGDDLFWPPLWLRPAAEIAGGCELAEAAAGVCKGPEVTETSPASDPDRAPDGGGIVEGGER